MWKVIGEAAGRWTETTTRREMAPFVQELIERRGLNITDDSRDRLAFALRDMWRDAAALMQRQAANAYGPDRAPERAVWNGVERAGGGGAAPSVMRRIDSWRLQRDSNEEAPRQIGAP